MQQVPRQMRRISVATQLKGSYWIVTHHPRAALLSLSPAPQAEQVLRFPTGLSFRVWADGGVGSEEEEPSCAWPMAALELTPPDVSAAVETDVTQLARKRLHPPLERGEGRETRGVQATYSREGRAPPTSHFSPALPPWVSTRAPSRPAPPPPGAGGALLRRRAVSRAGGRARGRPSRS